MAKASLLIVAVLTVLIAMGLRWREQRMPQVAQQKRAGMLTRGRKGIDRWVTAAAMARKLLANTVIESFSVELG